MDAPRLLLARDHLRSGRDAAFRAAIRERRLVAVCRGVWTERAPWVAARPEERMRLRARAHAHMCQDRPVFAFETAAALHGLPLWGAEDSRVHVLDPDERPARSRPGVFRHSGPLAPEDVTVRRGVLVTSLERTVADVVRTARKEAAISVLDAALRQVAWRGHDEYDRDAAEELRGRLIVRWSRMPGARGIRQARFLAPIGDGRADRPGESVSRLWMRILGAEDPELQYEVGLPSGRRAFLDFAWPRLRRFGEFDGDAKYLDPLLTSGQDMRGVLRAQRARETDVIAATGFTPVRWGSERLAGMSTFAAFLRAQGLLP
ncbi:hypothetical protein [Microbacterium sp. 10M-3C3]|jgi:hypothetical protein|uniref:hypothetical protein n=1 Tax=Microbacterium sp. 10M-3C3 TaxID=2483401 RepID=UPI000F638C13|nr:hypothetical protein [Microbacterium sp. 10M-3C3]